jgi:hypothetical protein
MKLARFFAVVLLNTLLAHCALSTDDTNVLSAGTWSRPVPDDSAGGSVRGRLLICGYPDHRGASSSRLDVAVYVELQEYSNSIGDGLQVYCDLKNGLACKVRDPRGEPPPPVGTGYSGGGPTAQWIKLAPFASARLRATMYAGGKLSDGGWGFWFPGSGDCTIKGSDTNTYYLSALLKVNPLSANTNCLDGAQVWRGTINLPPVEIPKAGKPQPSKYSNPQCCPNPTYSTRRH